MTANQNYKFIPPSSVITILFISIIFLLAWYTIDVLLLTFAAILLAIFLRTLNNLIQRVAPLPDNLSMSLVIVIIITLFIVMGTLMTPTVSEQVQAISNDIPNTWDGLNFLQNFLPQGNDFLLQATNLFSSTFGLIGSVLVIIVMGIFLAYDPNTYKKGFISLFPPSKQKEVGNIIKSITDILQWWIVGKICSMIIIGILTTLGLWFLSIPMALTLGLIAAILTFIPNIGPIISAIPAILIAYAQSPISAIYVIALYIAIQTLESYILAPLIQGKTIAQPPALVIFSQLIMGLLTGFLGLSLATPLLAAISVITKKVYIEEKNSNEKNSQREQVT